METPENKNDVFEPMPEEAAAQVTAENSADGNRPQKMAEAKKNLLAGALWCGGGLAFSFLSYYFATAGGRYVVATGAIIWGAIQAIKGLVVILKIQHQEGRFTAFWRTAAPRWRRWIAMLCRTGITTSGAHPTRAALCWTPGTGKRSIFCTL